MTLTREEKEDHVIFGIGFMIHVVAILCLASCFMKDGTASESDSSARDHSEVASNAQGEGAANEGVASIEGAIDRLTAEIIRSATQKETLVLWLLDASRSLNAQRPQIAAGLEKSLIAISRKKDIHPISHVVCGFGRNVSLVLKEPTNDKDRILKAFRGIALDDSGVELIFTSVELLASSYKSKDDRRTILVAFTDEAGNDASKADHTIKVAQQNGVAVYVLGTPAPFGVANTQFKFVDPKEASDQTGRWVEIEQGPESLFKMTLNISRLPIDSELMDSGYGPYALSKLCESTGGIYLALYPHTHVESGNAIRKIWPMVGNTQHFFDRQVMKKYPPDYRSDEIQRTEAESNVAKNALVKACSSNLKDLTGELKTVFDAPNQVVFVQELNEGQKGVAFLLESLAPIHAVLQEGEVAGPLLEEPRWKASYFLAMGRVLAIKTRLDAYNFIVAEAKGGLKAKSRWILEPSGNSDLLNGLLREQSESAKKYLETVVQEFPHTPWALMAQDELKVPFAYKWVESHDQPKAKDGKNTDKPGGPRDEKKKKGPFIAPKRALQRI